MRMSRDLPARLFVPVGIFALLAAGAVAQAMAYWPGIMIWDAIRQYGQALSGRFDDWHPPAFEWLWRGLHAVATGPAPMLIVQLTLYWGGFALLAGWALAMRRRGLSLAIAACAFFPVGYALMGAVIKDSLMAAALLTVTGLLAWFQRQPNNGLRVAAIIVLLCAMTLRFNGFLAGLPLLVALLPAAWRATRMRLAATTVLAAIPLVLAVPVANRALHAARSGVELSLIIYDLGGITRYSGVDVFPELRVADKVSVNKRCYRADNWDVYAWWGDAPCPIGFENIAPAFKASGQDPMLFWLKAIATHPWAYAEHRLGHFNTNIRFLVHDNNALAVPSQSDPNPWNYRVPPNPLHASIDRISQIVARTPLGWPAFWLAIALGVLLISSKLPSRSLVVPIASSALLYGSGYVVFSVASELRYHFWTMTASLLAAAIASCDLMTNPGFRRSTLIRMASPALFVAVCGIVWRAF